MKHKLRNSIIGGLVLIGLIGAAFSFSSKQTKAHEDVKTITLGSQATDTIVWEHIAKSDIAKKNGLNIKVKDYTDSAAIDKATANGDLDANAFQSYAYFVNFNKQSKEKLVALGTTYIQPMGLYSEKYKSVKQIPADSTIAIGNDAASQSRGLKLLESAGLIKLKPHDVSDLLTLTDIVKNKKNLIIKPIVSTTAPSALKDKGIAAVAIDNNTAQQAKLNVFKDAIYHEKLDQNTRSNVNVIATAEKNKNKSDYKKLVKIYHDKEIQKWIHDKYPGKQEVNESISALTK